MTEAILFRLTGNGRVSLPGYGIADAEHRLEKELAQLDLPATLRILEARRTDPEPRVVEEFELSYRLHLEVTITSESGTLADQRREAYGAARALLSGSRFAAVAWSRADRTSD